MPLASCRLLLRQLGAQLRSLEPLEFIVWSIDCNFRLTNSREPLSIERADRIMSPACPGVRQQTHTHSSPDRTTEPKLGREFFDSYASPLPGLGHR